MKSVLSGPEKLALGSTLVADIVKAYEIDDSKPSESISLEVSTIQGVSNRSMSMRVVLDIILMPKE